MKERIRKIKQDLRIEPGSKVQLEIPKEIYHRIRVRALAEEKRTGERVPYRDKVMECLLHGLDHLEKNER